MSHSSRKRIKSLSSINSLIVVPAYSRYWHTSIAYPGIIFVMCHQPVLCWDWEHFELHDMACVQLIISYLNVYNNYPSLLLLYNSEAESLLSVLINLQRVNIKLFLHRSKAIDVMWLLSSLYRFKLFQQNLLDCERHLGHLSICCHDDGLHDAL